MSQQQREQPQHHRGHFANQFMFFLKSGKGRLVWGDLVKESEGLISVMSSDGAVIQTFLVKDVESYRLVHPESEDRKK